jgi:HAD superfamily hydrolase (TIGR01490 family)
MVAHKPLPKRKVAIFDIDGTIFRSSLLIELVKALLRSGVFRPGIADIYTPAYRRWLDRTGPYDEYIGAVVKAFELNLKGVEERRLMAVAEEVISVHQERVYRYTRQLTQDLKSKGYFLLAISNSPKNILDPFCERWGFDKVYGRIYETDGRGVYTGGTAHLELISDKAKVLERAVEREALTLTGSVGVGDTEADIPFLELVQRPVCFNPNQKLHAVAKRRDWKVVVERKDMTYCVWPPGCRA